MENIINDSRIDTTKMLESSTLEKTKQPIVLQNVAKRPKTSSYRFFEETDNILQVHPNCINIYTLMAKKH